MKNIILSGAAMALLGTAAGEVTVSAAGLKVVGESYQGEKSEDELRPFNWTKGTFVALLLKSSEKAIVDFDEESSKIVSFTDDKETDFMKAKSRFSSEPYSFGMADFSEDRKALMTNLESPGLPAKGALSLSIKGEIHVSVASESDLKKSETVALKEGGEIEVAGHTFTIEEFGKPDWGDFPLEVSLKGSVDHENFRRVIFYDAEGKEIESERGGWSSFGMFGRKTYEVSYRLKKKVDQFSLGLDVWTDLEKVTVPLDLKVGVGL